MDSEAMQQNSHPGTSMAALQGAEVPMWSREAAWDWQAALTSALMHANLLLTAYLYAGPASLVHTMLSETVFAKGE